jgi:hypothetical protein
MALLKWRESLELLGGGNTQRVIKIIAWSTGRISGGERLRGMLSG